jgi:hypothetical protein
MIPKRRLGNLLSGGRWYVPDLCREVFSQAIGDGTWQRRMD